MFRFVAGKDDGFVARALPPEDCHIELQGLAEVLQAARDGLVDVIGLGASEPRRDVADEPLEAQTFLCGRVDARFEIETFGDFDD